MSGARLRGVSAASLPAVHGACPRGSPGHCSWSTGHEGVKRAGRCSPFQWPASPAGSAAVLRAGRGVDSYPGHRRVERPGDSLPCAGRVSAPPLRRESLSPSPRGTGDAPRSSPGLPGALPPRRAHPGASAWSAARGSRGGGVSSTQPRAAGPGGGGWVQSLPVPSPCRGE